MRSLSITSLRSPLRRAFAKNAKLTLFLLLLLFLLSLLQQGLFRCACRSTCFLQIPQLPRFGIGIVVQNIAPFMQQGFKLFLAGGQRL